MPILRQQPFGHRLCGSQRIHAADTGCMIQHGRKRLFLGRRRQTVLLHEIGAHIFALAIIQSEIFAVGHIGVIFAADMVAIRLALDRIVRRSAALRRFTILFMARIGHVAGLRRFRTRPDLIDDIHNMDSLAAAERRIILDPDGRAGPRQAFRFSDGRRVIKRGPNMAAVILDGIFHNRGIIRAATA